MRVARTCTWTTWRGSSRDGAIGAAQAGGRGDRVEVFTRRDDPKLPDVVTLAPGVRVVHVPAGPPEAVPKEQLLEHMGEFRDWMLRRLRDGRHPVDPRPPD